MSKRKPAQKKSVQSHGLYGFAPSKTNGVLPEPEKKLAENASAELRRKITELVCKDIFTRDDQKRIDVFFSENKLAPAILKPYFDMQQYWTDAWWYCMIKYFVGFVQPTTIHRYILQLACANPANAPPPTYNILSRRYIKPKQDDLVDFIGTLKTIVMTHFNNVDVSGYVEILIKHKQITDAELIELAKKNIIYIVTMPQHIQNIAAKFIETAPIQYVNFVSIQNAPRTLLEVLLRRCPKMIRNICVGSLDMELVETAIIYGDPWELFRGCGHEMEKMLDDMATFQRYKSEKFVDYYVNHVRKYTNVITEDDFEVYAYTQSYALYDKKAMLGMFLNYPHMFCAKNIKFDKRILKMLRNHPDKWKVAQALVFIYCNSDKKQQTATMFYDIFKYNISAHQYKQYNVYDTTYFATDKYAQFHPGMCRQALQRSESNLAHIRCRDDSLYFQYLEQIPEEKFWGQVEKFQHLPLKLVPQLVERKGFFDGTKQNSVELLANDIDFMSALPPNVLSYEDCRKFIQLVPHQAEVLFNTHRPMFNRLAKEGLLRSGALQFTRNNKKSDDICMEVRGVIDTRYVANVSTWGVSGFYTLSPAEISDFMSWVAININHIFFGENGVSLK